MKAVFFDAGGTLFRLAEPVGAVYARVGRRHGWEADAAVMESAFREAWRETPERAAVAGPRPDDDRGWWRDLVVRTLGKAGLAEGAGDVEGYFEALWAHYAEPGAWRLFADVPAALGRVRAEGARAGIVSNFDSRLRLILAGLGLGEAFDVVVISSEAGADKPHTQIFERALAAAGVAAAEAAHVGDDEQEDVEGARRAGLRAALVRRPGAGLVEAVESVLE